MEILRSGKSKRLPFDHIRSGLLFSLHTEDLIIDEAQQFPWVFSVLRGVVDHNRKSKGRFLLTGSSSPENVKGITESLAGRIATVEMWPFKQGELHQKPVSSLYEIVTQGYDPNEILNLKPVVSLQQAIGLWLKGGFPEPAIENSNDDTFHMQWMENDIHNYITRDIRGLFSRLNIHNFRRLLMLLAQYSGHQLNMSDMARALEISVSTVKDYLDIIHQTFLWRNLDPFVKNTLKKVQKAKRGFFGEIPIEIKLNSQINKRLLKGLENFIADMNTPFGLLINRGNTPERISEKIYQIPVNYI